MRVMTRAARAIVMVMLTKRAMAINGNNTDNGNSKEGGRQATAATMAMGRGAAQSTWPLMLNWREGDDGGDGPWFVCVFLWV